MLLLCLTYAFYLMPQNRGVYMFRIDNDTVIDATMAGGPARYINHSCNPNCAAEVVHFEKESKIIIITSRRISKGEEVSSIVRDRLILLSDLKLMDTLAASAWSQSATMLILVRWYCLRILNAITVFGYFS